MALAHEGNTDLAFDTDILREYGNRYGDIAEELRGMSKRLNDCLIDLKDSGWTTAAGIEFQKLAETNWADNIEKYAALLDTLKEVLNEASKKYNGLVKNHIERTKL